MLRNILKIIYIFVLLFAVAVVGVGYWYFNIRVAPLAKVEAPQPTLVKAALVTARDIPNKLQSVGTLLPFQSVNISPETAGQVSKILFKPGQEVKKGTPLIQLDDSIHKAHLDSAKADLALSEAEFKRIEQVVKQGAQPARNLDKAQADLKEKQAALEVSQVNERRMTLLAPFTGILGARTISVGDYVQVGQGLLAIVDKRNLRVRYRVSERYLSKLRTGQSVSIRSDAYPKQRFTGEVTFISPDVDETTRSVAIEAAVPNAKQELSPGLFVRVTQLLNVEKGALTIPESALVPGVEGDKVYKIQKGKAIETPVTIGARFAGWVQVDKGLAVGDQVITAGQDTIKDGSLVTVQP